MKKLVSFFKNFSSVIKIIRMIAEMMEAFAKIYEKYYPVEAEEKAQEQNNSKEDEK